MNIRAKLATFIFLIGPLLGSGCKQDIGLTNVLKELAVNPDIIDAGKVGVGEAHELVLKLTSLSGGDIVVTDIDVNNEQGDYFATDFTDVVLVPRNATTKITLHYTPEDVGYHRAVITVYSEAENGEVTIDVLGQAVMPTASLWPLAIDYGPIEVGSYAIGSVVLTNEGEIPVNLSSVTFTNNVFELSATLPLIVDEGDSLPLSILYIPTEDTPELGIMTLKVGSVSLPNVSLRGNDCEGGDPSAYDQDLDGFTNCSGDCDDLNGDVYPGAIELADGKDQDCDGIIDEGTIYYDDDGDGFAEVDGDCNDNDDEVSPDATENMTNGIDDDCDGVVDYGDSDLDGDGYNELATPPDCDDNDPARYPNAIELPDGIDNDCDNVVDEGTIYYDDDNDGFCEDPTTCTDGSTPGDCDDGDKDTYPQATELEDWIDNDCDGTVDEGTCNGDDDGDGYTRNGGDCDDTDPFNSPAQGVICPPC
jgi:hypothetical protein